MAKMDKNTRFWGFQCNGQKHWAEVCFGGEHYRDYTKIHNIPKRFIVPPFLPYFILLSAKSLKFLVVSVIINAQPNNGAHYTGICVSVMFGAKISANPTTTGITLKLRSV